MTPPYRTGPYEVSLWHAFKYQLLHNLVFSISLTPIPYYLNLTFFLEPLKEKLRKKYIVIGSGVVYAVSVPTALGLLALFFSTDTSTSSEEPSYWSWVLVEGYLFLLGALAAFLTLKGDDLSTNEKLQRDSELT